MVVVRPAPTTEKPQHLCLDKGYANAPAEAVVLEAGYVPHIRRIGEEKRDDQQEKTHPEKTHPEKTHPEKTHPEKTHPEKTHPEKTHPARRWVVERTFGWLSRCRAILVRYEKLAERYLATVKLACALLWFRRWHELDPTLTF